jgi:modification methylase
VLDPFFGTGTTGAVAKQLKRHFIGIEQDAVYVAAAQERITNVPTPLFDDEVYGVWETKRSAPRVRFGALVEHGLLLPGQPLFFNRLLDKSAIVLADGSLQTSDGLRGSIHTLGALMANLPSCNGWDHWFYQDDTGSLIVVDALREQVRRGMQQLTNG